MEFYILRILFVIKIPLVVALVVEYVNYTHFLIHSGGKFHFSIISDRTCS
jgi:hypothetical protein